jgi:RNA polymerase sigma-70 factor (ECF subfamily)
MPSDDPDPRLSRIDTLWSLVHRAHAGPAAEDGDAVARLLARYGGAVHRYLLGALRNPEAADELFQEFALRVVRGDFGNADPARGRFRDFLKAAAYRLVVDHHRRSQRRPVALPADTPEPVEDGGNAESFDEGWRDQLLDRTWQALRAHEQATGQPHHTVLRLRAERPTFESDELARELSARLGRPYTPPAARQALHRARERFADALLEEVARSLGTADPDRLREELADLGLFGYCRAALDRRRPRA